jgi:probable HAF family extracellular repeat protein
MNAPHAASLARAATALLAATAGYAAGAAPVLTPASPLDANALSMSADGSVVVGTQIFGAYVFRWTRAGGVEILGPAFGQASVSRDGSTIVADVRIAGQGQAAIWQGGTEWQSLGGYPGSGGCPDLSGAYAVADGGAVVVGLGWDDCDATAFRWEESTGMLSLGSLDGNASRANDLSADGAIIVGWDDDNTGARRGARWVNGVESLLTAPDGIFVGGAEAVSADGKVIVGGNAGNDFVRNRAYRWTEEHGGEIIGMLPGDSDLAAAYAFAVNDDGSVVVGASGDDRREAFVWTRTTGMFRLQDYLIELGVELDDWTLDTALAISSDGTVIAGWGYRGTPPFLRVQSWIVEDLPAFVDTDTDGVLDGIDNCTLKRNEDQRDTDGDLYGNRCDPDFDDDLVVDRDDTAYLQSVLGTDDPDGDLDGDGIVGATDVRITRNFLGQPPGPSGRVQ